MESLTVVTSLGFFNSLLFFVLIGVAFFAFSMMAMVVFFGFSLKKLSGKGSAFVIVLAMSLALPLGIAGLQKQTGYRSLASENVKVESKEVVRSGKDSFVVNIITSRPVILYLNYKDFLKTFVVPVLPTATLEPRTDHSFIISGVGDRGGEATIMIDSQAYKIDGQTIKIHD